MRIPEAAFASILEELRRQPLPVNNYRKKSGEGRSQAFGLVNRRCMPPDYSRQCWKRPYLYKLLLDFAEQHVDISFNAITVNQGYKADKHRDKGNVGDSFLVGFGDYKGGELLIHEGDLSGSWNIRGNPIVTDFSRVLHSVADFTGERVSLVYYTLKGVGENIPKSSVKWDYDTNKWVFYRGNEKIGHRGLEHPLRKS